MHQLLFTRKPRNGPPRPSWAHHERWDVKNLDWWVVDHLGLTRSSLKQLIINVSVWLEFGSNLTTFSLAQPPFAKLEFGLKPELNYNWAEPSKPWVSLLLFSPLNIGKARTKRMLQWQVGSPPVASLDGTHSINHGGIILLWTDSHTARMGPFCRAHLDAMLE